MPRPDPNSIYVATNYVDNVKFDLTGIQDGYILQYSLLQLKMVPVDPASIITVSWGGITGTLSDQADLQAALDGKAAVSHSHIIADVTGLQTELDSKLDETTFTSHPAYSITSGDITNIGNLSGVNTGDQDLSGYALTSSLTDGSIDAVFNSVDAGTTDGYLTKTSGGVLANSGVYETADGKVGIGTVSPSAKLEINGSSPVLAIRRVSNSENSSIDFQGAAGSVGARINFGSNDLGFYTYNTSLQERMKIDSSGQVGIGTSSPSQLLHVNKSANDAMVLIETEGAGSYLALDSASSGYYGMQMQSSGTVKWFVGGYGSNDLSFIDGARSSGTTAMIIKDTTGYVGIGTTDPAFKLDVNGDINIASGSNYKVNGVNLESIFADISHNHTGIYQPIDPNLTAIAALAGTSGFLTKTAADTWALDTNSYSLSTHDHSGVYEPAFSKNTAFNKDFGSTSGTVAEGDHNHTGIYEPVFSKNSAFNKNFGTTSGTVAQGNHTHTGVYEPANANIQSHISLTNEHIDWTDASSNFKTSGSVSVDGMATGNSELFILGAWDGYKRIQFGDEFEQDRARIQLGSMDTFLGFYVGLNSPLLLYADGKVRLPEYGSLSLTGTAASYPAFDSSGYFIELSGIPFGDLTGVPTTLSGYGITDAYTKTEIGTPDTNFVTVFEAALS